MTRRILHYSARILSAAFLFVICPIYGQHNNPTGPAGFFNGNSSVGCSYDPYTANATRTIPDITVAGAVGAYPLQWARTMNSRGVAHLFGSGGGWRHSYDWSLGNSQEWNSQNPSSPTYYDVGFPDGRSIHFTSGLPNDTCFRGPLGVHERFQPLNLTTRLAYLLLPDGGQVEFTATSHRIHDDVGWTSWWSYQATAIIDPNGLRTTFTYNTNGTLSRVTEPAGRWLQISYASGRISQVQAGYTIGSTDTVTQSVSYVYGTFGGYPVLSVASYNDGTSASYYYQASNVAPYTGYPLILTCNDVRYPGPMKKIAYDFVPNGFYGQFAAERYWVDSTIVVSYNLATHTETRGDGATRTFTYGTYGTPVPPLVGFTIPAGAPYLLASYTDFKGNKTYLSYDTKGYLNKTRDARLNVTSFTRATKTGNLLSVTLPAIAGQPASTTQYVYTDQTTAYYLDHVTDPLNHTTSYGYDANMNKNRIDYPDGGFETFTYNGFNQVLTHRNTSGGTETFSYDSRGRLTNYTPPATPSDPNPAAHPTIYTYNVNDQLSTIKDPRLNTTTLFHNQRGQLTIVRHPGGSQRVWSYNDDGTLDTFTDELGHATTFTYDHYKRLMSVTTPLRAPGDTTPRTTYFWYQDAGGAANNSAHTDSQVRRLVLPSGKVVVTLYDENFRKVSVTQGFGTADAAKTTFEYDAAGNLTKVIEPTGQPGGPHAGADWDYAYDARNRRMSVTDPFGKTTSWEYDAAGNLKKEIRPDGQFRQWSLYDAMNRVKQTIGFLNESTSYTYNLAGNLTRLTDSKGANYDFAYDALGRKTSATYPLDAYGASRYEAWSYDAAGNLATYRTPFGWIKTFTYDNRNRPTYADWNTPSGQDVSITYDAASRVTSIASGLATVSFGYDNANNKIWEDQALINLPTRRVITGTDADGNRSSVTLAGVYALLYEHTNRQQLSVIKSTADVRWFEYKYDPNGNLKQRQNMQQGLDSTKFEYDKMNRVTLCEQTGASDVSFARTNYGYDLNTGNLQYLYREEQANEGERFTYEADNQLKDVFYNATAPWNPAPAAFDRKVTYTYPANRLNRTSMNDDGVVTNYTPNWLNQYTAVTGQSPVYDGNFNLYQYDGSIYTHDADGRLISVAKTGQPTAQFSYDGLGRCVKRVIGNVATFYTYDGWQPIAEWTWNGAAAPLSAWNMYGPGADEILVRWSPSSGHLHYHSDHMGNVQFLLNTANVGIEKYTYDVFGQPKITDWNGNVRTQSAYGNRFMFNGREYLSTLGIYDYRARYYHPGLGRFLETDPTRLAAGDANLYRYCGNNPANSRDPFGLQVDATPDHKINGDEMIIYGSPVDWTGRDSPGGWRLGDISSLPSRPGGLEGSRGERGDGFSIRTGVKEVPLIPPPTLPEKPLPQVPTQSTQQPTSTPNTDQNWLTQLNDWLTQWQNWWTSIFGSGPLDGLAPNRGQNAWPGNDATKGPLGTQWRGQPGSTPGDGRGNFYNPQTGEWFRPELNHPYPIGPHWDYYSPATRTKYRIFQDGRVIPKAGK